MSTPENPPSPAEPTGDSPDGAAPAQPTPPAYSPPAYSPPAYTPPPAYSPPAYSPPAYGAPDQTSADAPSTPPYAATGAYPPPAYPAAYPQQPQPQQSQQPYGAAPSYGYGYGGPRNNVLAIISMIASILGAVWILPFIGSLAGAIMGHISLKQIARTGEKGRGMALAGVIVGWIGLGLFVALIAFFIILAIVTAQSSSYYDYDYN